MHGKCIFKPVSTWPTLKYRHLDPRFSRFPCKFIRFKFNLNASKDTVILPLKSYCYETRTNREKGEELYGEKIETNKCSSSPGSSFTFEHTVAHEIIWTPWAWNMYFYIYMHIQYIHGLIYHFSGQ